MRDRALRVDLPPPPLPRRVPPPGAAHGRPDRIWAAIWADQDARDREPERGGKVLLHTLRGLGNEPMTSV